MSRTALFPGTFDPPTRGHLDIIERGAQIFDTLYVGLAQNFRKERPLFSVEERKEMLHHLCRGMAHVEVVCVEGALYPFFREKKIGCLFRAIRQGEDLPHEFGMASVHREQEKIETLFLMAREKYQWIQSSLVKEMAQVGMDLSSWIPDEILPLIKKKFS